MNPRRSPLHTEGNSSDWPAPEDVHLAFLHPNKPDSATLKCAACQRTSTVTRQRCLRETCRSNVVSAEPDTLDQCLVCLVVQEELRRDAEWNEREASGGGD